MSENTTNCNCKDESKRTMLDTLTVTVPLSLYNDLIFRAAKAEADYSNMCSTCYELRTKLAKIEQEAGK